VKNKFFLVWCKILVPVSKWQPGKKVLFSCAVDMVYVVVPDCRYYSLRVSGLNMARFLLCMVLFYVKYKIYTSKRFPQV
jgi:hypothetical protein